MGKILLAGIGDILSINEYVAPLALRTDIRDGALFFGFDLSLLIHLCGEIYSIESGMAHSEARQELHRQLPWLFYVSPPREAFLREDWALVWAWVDKMGQRYGHVHPVRAMDPLWRTGVSLSTFRALDQDDVPVGFEDLPEDMQAALRSLGYSDGVV